MREKRLLAALAVALVLSFTALGAFGVLRETRRMRLFLRDREVPALGQTAAARLDVAAFRYRRAGEELLQDGFILDWLDSGERDPAALIAFMEKVRSRHGLLDASIVSDRSETYYGTDGRVLKLSPENVERDGWYYLYRETVLDTTIDAWYYPETGMVGIYVNVPLLDREGKYRGVVGGGIDTTYFSRILESIESKKCLRVYMARRDGQLVYATDRSLLAQPVRNLDELWGMRIADSLRREQHSLDGIVFEPGGKGEGAILWGRYLPDWDTFLVIEWLPEALDSILRDGAGDTLAWNWMVSIALLGLASATIYVAYRVVRSAEDRGLSRDLRLRAVIHGLLRILAAAEARLAEGGGEALGRQRRALERFLRDADEGRALNAGPAPGGLTPGTVKAPELAAAVQDALLRAGAAASHAGLSFHLEIRSRALAAGASSDPILLGLALDELVESTLGRAAPDSEIMIALRDDPRSEPPVALLDLAFRLGPAGEGRSPEALAARELLGALGASLDELGPEPGLGVYRATFPLAPGEGSLSLPPKKRSRRRERS